MVIARDEFKLQANMNNYFVPHVTVSSINSNLPVATCSDTTNKLAYILMQAGTIEMHNVTSNHGSQYRKCGQLIRMIV